MGHERSIEAMRDARHGLPPDGMRRVDRRRGGRVGRRGRSRRRRVLRLLIVLLVLVAVAVAAVALVALLTGGGSGGGFAGTWEKNGPGTGLVIKEVGDGRYAITVVMGESAAGAGGAGAGQASPGGRQPRVSKATLDGEVLTAKNMLGIPGWTFTFTLEDDGDVLVQTFPNGSEDRLDRVAE